jgi:hypothetical protein
MRLAVASMITLLSCVSCSPAPPPPSTARAEPSAAPAQTAAPAAPAVEMAPAPYTAAQIRDASPTGRRIVYKVEEPDKPARKHVIEFIKSDATGAEVRSYDTDDKGAPIDLKTTRATWEELRSHAEFPKDKVEIKHRTVSISIGTLECQVYKVTEDGKEADTVTYYFADTIPGPPVFFHAEKGGKRTLSHTMESNSGPK